MVTMLPIRQAFSKTCVRPSVVNPEIISECVAHEPRQASDCIADCRRRPTKWIRLLSALTTGADQWCPLLTPARCLLLGKGFRVAVTEMRAQSSLRAYWISGHFEAKVIANIGITVTARSLPINFVAVHASSSQYRSVHTPPIQRIPEERSLLHTGMKSAIFRLNTSTV